MAPQLPSMFGVAPTLLPKLFDVGSREAYDPLRGVKPGTLASLINRANNPVFGPSGNWLNPGQYAVLQSKGFNPQNPNIAKAQAYYSSPEGRQELANVAHQLGGVTDFRSTKYLRDTGNLLNYPTNLIPAVVQGVRKFLTPQQLRKYGAQPDLTENTFFNETQRPPTKEWWKSLMPGQQQSALPGDQQYTAQQLASAPDQRSVEDILGSALGLVFKPGLDETNKKSQGLLDTFKNAIAENMITPLLQKSFNPFDVVRLS